jgi:hypothetical protein
MEALKPLVVLALFGMILYGAYSVIQKGPATEADVAPAVSSLADAPPIAPPDVHVPAPQPAPTAAPSTAASPVGIMPAVVAPANPAGIATEPATTYLAAESAAPPSADQVAGRTPTDPASPPTPVTPPPPAGAAAAPAALTARLSVEPPAQLAGLTPADPLPAVASNAASGAFASAWADAHEKLAAGRYAEALAGLSVWYDDPALGLEESQRLEDLLGQLAGTVIYSQQDLLLPPHVVAPGETLPALAGPLGVSPELLAKINGVDDPQRLVPGEHLKLVRGPFDAVVSVSRRRVSLQLNGAYAGSFPVIIGRGYLEKVGASLPVVDLQRGVAGATAIPAGTASLRKAIVLGEGLVIEAVDDPVAVADAAPQTSLVMSVRDLDEMLDILGPASRVLVRQ